MSTETKYEPNGVELENKRVRCPGCGETLPVNDAAMSLDQVDSDGENAVLRVVRRYLCSEACALDYFFGNGEEEYDG